MNADPKAVQKIFAQAVAFADPNLRQVFIREQCAHDAELLRRVEELLAAYDEPKPFFDQPTAQLDNSPASAPLQPAEASQRPGSMVAGRYKLLEAIGEGGMGTVWVAEQTSPVRRKVALKLVKPGMDSKQVLARFDAERQALALMDHPNIAKVFDRGRFIVCSPADNSLAFFRRPLRSEPTELWLYDPVSNTESKLTNGIPYCWTNDGMLCYRPWRSEQAVCVDPKQLDMPIWTRSGARSPERNAAVSRDGKRYAQPSFGKWSIFDLQQTLEMPPASYDSTDTGRADWSADGRWIAHSTHIDDEYGVWLIDTHTHETRLLAELAAYPRWSPDGKTLVLGLRSSNEIVLLDVSSLDTLWNENQAESPKQP